MSEHVAKAIWTNSGLRLLNDDRINASPLKEPNELTMTKAVRSDQHARDLLHGGFPDE